MDLENLNDVAALGDAARVAKLLEEGADPGMRGADGRTPLMNAARGGSVEALRLLLPVSDPAALDAHGCCCLHWAARSPSPACLAELAGLAVLAPLLDLEDAHGNTPLSIACSWGSMSTGVELAKALLDAGAKADSRTADGQVPLMMACQSVGPALVALLLAWGADPHAQDEQGLSCMGYAALSGQKECVALLAAAGAALDGAGAQERLVKARLAKLSSGSKRVREAAALGKKALAFAKELSELGKSAGEGLAKPAAKSRI